LEHFLGVMGPALLAAAVAILINRFDREKNSGRFAGVVESSLQGITGVIEGFKEDVNRRLDEIRENQKSAWVRIDAHNREIGRLEGKIEALRSGRGNDGRPPA
jgi:hypothetical protein